MPIFTAAFLSPFKAVNRR